MVRHDIPPVCRVCDYRRHVEVSHIKAVSSFTDDVTVARINEVNNLVFLCPTHHWEFDNGYLDFEAQGVESNHQS